MTRTSRIIVYAFIHCCLISSENWTQPFLFGDKSKVEKQWCDFIEQFYRSQNTPISDFTEGAKNVIKGFLNELGIYSVKPGPRKTV